MATLNAPASLRMTYDQIAILSILAATVALFMWGRWRHDVVALTSLISAVALGLVPSNEAFAGFGHPAVITVACVLVLSSALQSTGAIDLLARKMLPNAAGPTASIASLTCLAALLSAFMNNVGALALLMPVGLQLASRLSLPPGKVLMPLAFGSILGGMSTLIGTPPNLIVSSFRDQTTGQSFAMFDFSPVGVPVALAGLAFLVAIGWRIVPTRRPEGKDTFETGAYLTEARVPEKSKSAGKTLREIETAMEQADAQVIGLVRNDMQIPAPSPFREVRAGDILIIEAEPEALAEALSSLDLKLEETLHTKPNDQEGADRSTEEADSDRQAGSRSVLQSEDVTLMELAVRPHGQLVGRSAREIRLRNRYGINLLAVSRKGRRSVVRLKALAIEEGDVLLMQGSPESIREFASHYGCVPLAERPLRVPDASKALTASAIMAAAIGGAAFGLVPAAIAFASAVLASVLLRVVPVRQMYDAIDWSIIVLLGGLIPVAGAMASTGAADLLAKSLLGNVAQGNIVIALAVVLVITMTLSDFMNNAATAAVMCPIAIGIATQLDSNPEPFLMAVAVAASCAFLTPIGHQNNTLILGPGGFKFGDYWKLGLPLEIVVITVSIPLILWVWPP